jgi:hypothetical protein
VDADTKWATLELMLASSASVLALAKKMTNAETKQSLFKNRYPVNKSVNNR